MASKFVTAVLVTACVGAVAAAVGPGLSRGLLRTAEKSGDESLITAFNKNSLLGNTRAVYLPGYGVVFSAEMDVAPESTPNPFNQDNSRERISRIKDTKKQRIAQLREQMRRLAVGYADTVQINDGEYVAVSVTLLYSKIEDTDGMPKQIVMWAPRGTLRSGNAPVITATLKVQELF